MWRLFWACLEANTLLFLVLTREFSEVHTIAIRFVCKLSGNTIGLGFWLRQALNLENVLVFDKVAILEILLLKEPHGSVNLLQCLAFIDRDEWCLGRRLLRYRLLLWTTLEIPDGTGRGDVPVDSNCRFYINCARFDQLFGALTQIHGRLRGNFRTSRSNLLDRWLLRMSTRLGLLNHLQGTIETRASTL